MHRDKKVELALELTWLEKNLMIVISSICPLSENMVQLQGNIQTDTYKLKEPKVFLLNM